MERGTWIACVGPIGVGKSTLAAVVARRTGSLFVPERFGDNAFLERFYAPDGIKRWGFQTEVSFLTQRFDHRRHAFLSRLAHQSIHIWRYAASTFRANPG